MLILCRNEYRILAGIRIGDIGAGESVGVWSQVAEAQALPYICIYELTSQNT